MNRLWSILFFLVPVCGIGAFVFAAYGVGPLRSAWLPENFSESGIAIDQLWYLVHWICAFFFALTGLLITWVIWRYSRADIASASYIKSSLPLELAWSIVPAAILVGLAFYQMNAWSAQKANRPTINVATGTIAKPPTVYVVAKQFGWEFRYPGGDQKFNTLDDFSVENLMVVPDNATTVMQLSSRDVIHSFFVPKLRLKHDVVPGMTQIAWFTPKSSMDEELSIVCAELCGWGHYKMIARLKIVPRKQYDAWITEQQNRISPPELEPYTGSMP